MNAELIRLEEARRTEGSLLSPPPRRSGDRTSASASGAPCARTTAQTATPGTSSPTIMPARAPTAGARTASPAFPTTSSCLCFSAGPVERQGPDPQGTALRPHQQRRQPWRGRQGVLLLPRQHADGAGGVAGARGFGDRRDTVRAAEPGDASRWTFERLPLLTGAATPAGVPWGNRLVC